MGVAGEEIDTYIRYGQSPLLGSPETTNNISCPISRHLSATIAHWSTGERQRREHGSSITNAMELTWANSRRWWGQEVWYAAVQAITESQARLWLLNNNQNPNTDKSFKKRESGQVSANKMSNRTSCDSSYGDHHILAARTWPLHDGHGWVHFFLITWYTRGLFFSHMSRKPGL